MWATRDLLAYGLAILIGIGIGFLDDQTDGVITGLTLTTACIVFYRVGRFRE